jgi:signal transduction histidine kinase
LKVFNNTNTGRDTKLLLMRRIKLTAMALLFILLSLVAFAAITLTPEILSALSEINLTYSSYVRLTNAIIAIICAAFLLWPRDGGQLVGRWNDYVGAAFLTFFVLYGVRFIGLLLVSKFPGYDSKIDFATDVVVYLGSYFNNILFLAAARVLLNKNRRVAEPQLPGANAGGFQRLNSEWAALRAALPRWYWVMFPVSMLALLEHYDPQLLWARFPDTIFSVYCLSWFAYSIWLSFHVRRRMMLAWLGFILILAYAAGQLVYASNPFIASSVSDYTSERQPPATWVRSYLREKVSDKLAEIHAKKPNESTFDIAKGFFDGAIFAILFPMKTLLFLPAFILYLMSIISVNDFRQALRETTSKRKDYLSKDGILSVIGRSMEADEVRLIIRLPGVKRRHLEKEERVIAEVWSASDTPPLKKEPRIYPLKDDDLLVRVMQVEGKEIIITNEDDGEVAVKLREVGPSPQTLALIPIKFHGGAIGALKVIFRGYGKYNNGILEQLKFMAELIAPSVQDFRTVSAVDKLGSRLSRTQTSRPANGFKTATEKLGETLYDLLNPLAVGLFLECGFTTVKPIFPKEGIYHDLLEKPNVGHYEMLKNTEAEHVEKPPIIMRTDDGLVRIEHDELSIRTEKGTPYDLGSLILAIPHVKDEFAKPTLAAYYLTRRMLASLTAHGIFNAARNSLGVVIQDLSVALNKETLSVEEWFDEVEAAIKKSGLIWVVASEGNGLPLRGKREHVETVEGLKGVDKENVLIEPLGCIPHRAPESDTRHIIHLRLKESGQRLWLGVERAGFTRELNFQSPWKVFLETLQSVAGTALVRIEDRQRAEVKRHKEEAERLKQAEDEWLTAFADLTAMLMHQLVNMVKNLLGITDDALESVGDEPLASNGQLLASTKDIKKAGEMMLDFTNAYNKLIEIDGYDSCHIAEAAQRAVKLFLFALRKKSIDIEIKVTPAAEARVPSNVVALVLANLIGNAIQAILQQGKITIEAGVDGDAVWCHVINDGPPIPDEIKPQLFLRGAKGKNGHSGWGLYLISRFLKNYEGSVALKYSNSEGTCFTLRLPKSVN